MKRLFGRLLFIIVLVQLHNYTFAQDSSHLRISLLTCTPGRELYTTFAHSALRIVDSSQPRPYNDVVFNYGTFNFDEDFYFKFIRGKLDYFLFVGTYDAFLADYQQQNRGITEQVLNMNAKEKIA